MISPYHLTQQSRDELMAVSADHRARLKAKRECDMKRHAADEERNLLARVAASNLSRRFDGRYITFWGELS